MRLPSWDNIAKLGALTFIGIFIFGITMAAISPACRFP